MSVACKRIVVWGAAGSALFAFVVGLFWLGGRLSEWQVVLMLGGIGVCAALCLAIARWFTLANRELQPLDRERQLNDLFDKTTVGVEWVDPNGRIIRANPAELELLGYSESEYVGRPLTDFHTDPEAIQRILERAAAGETIRNHESRVRTKDDSIKHVRMDCNAFRQDGEIAYFQIFTRNTGERMNAEEDSHQESERRFRFLADKAPVLIWMSDASMGFDYLNKSWLDFTGHSLEQELGDKWLQAIHEEDRANCWETYSSSFQERLAFTMDYRLRRYDGAYRWVLNTGVPRFTQTGFFYGYIGSCVDITERKHWEEDQQRALSALEEIDRKKDQFLAVLSHELRNPLAPILNALHLLHDGAVTDPGAKDAVGVIERQVQMLANIVDDLLDVFRIAHQKLTLRKEPLNIADVVRTSVQDHRIAMEAPRLNVRMEMPREPVWILADRTRIAQILSNVFNNTAKFTNPGDSVFVRVAQDPTTAQAVISVRDTGVGVAPEMLPRMFETFTQADQSFDRNKGGLGLGLALVKGLVELHGGQVALDSPGLGKGTTITLRFPLGKPPLDVVVSPVAPSIGRPLRILIVEDNRDTARTLGVLLTRSGHRVRLAYTGVEGVELAKTEPPDVVLCDLGLPEMDGYQVAQTLRQDPALNAIRMIAVSGYGQEEDRQRSEAAGFDLHLTKPVDPLDLQRLLAVLKIGP